MVECRSLCCDAVFFFFWDGTEWRSAAVVRPAAPKMNLVCRLFQLRKAIGLRAPRRPPVMTQVLVRRRYPTLGNTLIVSVVVALQRQLAAPSHNLFFLTQTWARTVLHCVPMLLLLLVAHCDSWF